jgi:hypothetical protein
MNGADLATQALDLILQVQLTPLDLQYFQIIDREMPLSLGKLGFQRFMPHFKFNKVRLDGHQEGLLVSDFGPTYRTRKAGRIQASRRGASAFALLELVCHATSRKSTNLRLCDAANRWISLTWQRNHYYGTCPLP